MVRRTRWVVAAGLMFVPPLVLVLLPSTALAQTTTATVIGTVKDTQGAVVPGATVALISESRARQVAETVTDATGDFVLPNTDADTYTIQVSLAGFKTLSQTGIAVSPGDRLRLPALVLEVGTFTETVKVTGETPLVQASSGERSFTIPTTSVENLPIASRNFSALALLTPGVMSGGLSGVTRLGWGGGLFTNVMIDGISVIDTGNNGQFLLMNTDAVAEVKVLTSAYQAEYGRFSGIQVLSVTKSGTNTFRGSVYDIKRNSDWNQNSWYNKQMGYAKSVSRQDDWGYTIGGPIGKTGGSNKLFFFHSIEFRPRETGSVAQTFRVPTELERNGNFSQSRDNTGNLYPYIRDYTTGLPCSATNTAGCFQYNGVVGWIPPDRLYAPGMALLRMYPVMPNVEQTVGMGYNVQQFSSVIKTLEYQPAVRVDYQISPAIRLAVKYNGHNRNSGLRNQYETREIDGLTNFKGNQKPWIHTLSVSANVKLGSRTFLEAIWGGAQVWYVLHSTAPLSNRFTAKLDGIPLIYPDARAIDPATFTYKTLSDTVAPFFVNGRIELPPGVSFGTRASSAVGTPTFYSWENTNKTWDLAASLTHVRGRHTIKAGVSLNHSYKAQNVTYAPSPFGTISFANDTNNPYDTGYGYANAAVGTFSTYTQASRYAEAGMVALGTEPYLQDNWRVTNRLTLDYGLRFVHLQPDHDTLMQASQFFPEQWSAANAPALYVPGCPGGVYPCPSTRQAMNPMTGQLLGPGTASLIGQAVPGTGNAMDGLKKQGEGIADTNFTYPFVELAPRVGVAYLLRPDGRWVLRGGFGLFYDRADSNATMFQSANPPTVESTTMYFGQLQALGAGGVSSKGIPNLNIYRYENRHLPSSAQWNIGTQLQLPFAFALDVSYVGQKAYHWLGNMTGGGSSLTNLNGVDLGAAYLPENQDPTLAPSSVPGATAYSTNLLRTYKGYGTINQAAQDFWSASHSLQVSLQRRFANGFSAGLNWNWTLHDVSIYGVYKRVQHTPDGKVMLRTDQKAYEDLFSDNGVPTHILKGNFVWDLPDLHGGSGVAMRVVRNILNDWQLSGVWSGQTGGGYMIGYSYSSGGSNVNLTGSPDYPARIKIVGDPGSGCSIDQYRQFNTAAFAGPTYYSNGMESGSIDHLTACGTSIWDLAIARNIRLGGTRSVQIRIEMYNALNSTFFTSRQMTVQYNSPTDQTVRNNQFNADGSLNQARLKPNVAGFGAVNNTNNPRTFQLQLRFAF